MLIDKQGMIATGAALVTFVASAATNSPAAPIVEGTYGAPRPVNISLTSFNLSPETLQLKAGEPILLRIANDSGLAHDLTAPEFFKAAAIRPADAMRIVSGKIAVSPHNSLIIAMIPAAGRFPVKCSHPFHKMLGMSGIIVVDS